MADTACLQTMRTRLQQAVRPRAAGSSTTSSPSQRFLDGDSTPILLTYMSHLRPRWLLGISAAHHALPLAVAGLGRRFTFADKLLSAERAVRMLHHLNPGAPVIFADGVDTIVANRLLPATQQRLQRAAREGKVILGAECFSYPLCYRELYRNHSAHQRCRASGAPTCYANSGLYAGSSAVLLQLLTKAHEVAVHGQGVEQDDDQAAIHRLLLQGALAMEVDSESAIFLNLHPCRGHNFKAPPKGRKSRGQITMCFYEPHDPLSKIVRRKDEVWYRGATSSSTANDWTQPTATRSAVHSLSVRVDAADQRPLLVHANGFHSRLSDAYFGKGNTISWETIFAGTAAMNAYPVLLFDSPIYGRCNVSTLGDLA
mmetsp:Transcript_31664/g.78899  ORF Transcript_31664/g.78899 Transcript_31664/m.78899 type:complete len:371 (-) Transcript_31664:114-1226(-)